MTRLLAILFLLWPTVLFAVDEDGEKSLFFAGRCLAQLINGEPIDAEGLAEMPADPAKGHLFGSEGQVFFGTDDRFVLVLHKATHCGVNAFDETADDLGDFLAYWLERDQSPFQLTEDVTLDNGDRRIAYDGHCTECGFDIHARGYWFKTAGFSVYRVFATKPEGS